MVKKGLVSVVFPTMDRKDFLLKCIDSLLKSTYKNIEIILADNASTDGSADSVRKKFPHVRIIRNELNFGSPAAMNQCIRASNGEYIFRFEDDVEITPKSLGEMIKLLESDEKIGMVSCPYYFTEEPEKLRYAGIGINLFTGKTKNFAKNCKDPEECAKTREIPAAGGGSQLIRRKTFEEIGSYDETYYLCYEDIDWSYRLRKKGYKIMLCDSAKMFHTKFGGLALREDPHRIFFLNRGMVMFMRKNASWRNIIFLPLFIVGIGPYRIIRLLLKNNLSGVWAVIKGFFSGLIETQKFVYTRDWKKVRLSEQIKD